MDKAHSILLSYVQSQRKALKLPDDQPALAILDQFKHEQTHTFHVLLTPNHIMSLVRKCLSA